MKRVKQFSGPGQIIIRGNNPRIPLHEVVTAAAPAIAMLAQNTDPWYSVARMEYRLIDGCHAFVFPRTEPGQPNV